MKNSHTSDRKNPLSAETLQHENEQYHSTGGISAENRSLGFAPAFLDCTSGKVYLSRFADGRLAPVHLLEGLPLELMQSHGDAGERVVVKDSVIAGFVFGNEFYSRQQAAAIVAKRTIH